MRRKVNEDGVKCMVWLLCRAAMRGKLLTRTGMRTELIDNSTPAEWTFCPLLKDSIPRDRVWTERCEKCENFGGYREVKASLSLSHGDLSLSHGDRQLLGSNPNKPAPYNVRMIPPLKKAKIPVITEAEWRKSLENAERSQEGD